MFGNLVRVSKCGLASLQIFCMLYFARRNNE